MRSKLKSTENDENRRHALVEDEEGRNESLDDVCRYMGCLTAPPNISTSADRILAIHFHPNGKYVGLLHSNSKHIDVYTVRSVRESLRKKQRRLKRRKEKASKVSNGDLSRRSKGQKRGMLDDPEPDEDVADQKEDGISKLEKSLDPDNVKASDEFEFFGTARASHKVKGFIFVPFKEKGESLRLVCSLATNAIEILSLREKKERYVSYRTVLDRKFVCI